MIYYVVGVVISYLLFQAWDVYNYLKEVNSPDAYTFTKPDEMEKLQKSVAANLGAAAIFPLSWAAIAVWATVEGCTRLVTKIAERLEK